MKILLLGDYSNVHATLAKGLRELGHEVVVASDGDGWKNYERDVDLRRKSKTKWASFRYFFYLLRHFRHFRNFDVVQLINPIFLPSVVNGLHLSTAICVAIIAMSSWGRLAWTIIG